MRGWATWSNEGRTHDGYILISEFFAILKVLNNQCKKQFFFHGKKTTAIYFGGGKFSPI
jgi:hypothetical protein